jgi:hyperosmotically inducible periplasmic protein
MDNQPKVSNLVLLGALVAVAATAWAMDDSMPYSLYTTEEYVAAEEPAAPANDVVAPNESLSPNESVVTTNDTSATKAAPIEERSVAQPPITVETRRLTDDERIQAQVMDKLASNPNLSGKIGVEANDAVVRLSGWTSTVGQAYRAGLDAGSITGVKYVQNEIRPRVGGSL